MDGLPVGARLIVSIYVVVIRSQLIPSRRSSIRVILGRYLVYSLVNHSERVLIVPISDLDHYDCNVVYKPWVSKGQRRPRSMWSDISEYFALLQSLSA